MPRISEALSTELAMISYECNIVKVIVQARIQYKKGKLLVLGGQITLSQSELCQMVIDIENLKQKISMKKYKQSVKWDDVSLQNISEDEEE